MPDSESDPFAQLTTLEQFVERADRWSMFAAAALGGRHVFPDTAASWADELLALYDERFPLVEPPVGGASPVPGVAGDA